MAESEIKHYLIRMEFLGFRYHGWQYQPGVRTIEGMFRKTFRFVIPGIRAKLIGAGRTDARVSALDFAAQLILKGTNIPPPGELHQALNANLPPDIRIRSIGPIPPSFNAITCTLQKTYRYRFCHGERPHPFTAALLGYFPARLDIGRMEAACNMFLGTHDFRGFTASPNEMKQYIRRIDRCCIAPIGSDASGCYPGSTHELEVAGPGFGRYQIRLMMGALADIGEGRANFAILERSLNEGNAWPFGRIAPASGLQLLKTEFKDRSL